MAKELQKKSKRGEVISDKMDKTIVVKIDRVKSHPIYNKKFTVSKNIKAHDGKNEYHIGDFVEIIETRPVSKNKFFRVTGKAKR